MTIKIETKYSIGDLVRTYLYSNEKRSFVLDYSEISDLRVVYNGKQFRVQYAFKDQKSYDGDGWYDEDKSAEDIWTDGGICEDMEEFSKLLKLINEK